MHAGFSGRPRSSMNQPIIGDVPHPMNDGAFRAAAKRIAEIGPVVDDRKAARAEPLQPNHYREIPRIQ